MCMEVRLNDVRGAIAERLSSEGRYEDISSALNEFERRFCPVGGNVGSKQRDSNFIEDYFEGVILYG